MRREQDIPEEQKLPATWEEYQRARREAFALGAEWSAKMAEESAFPPSCLEVGVKAREAYPIRVRKPRRVALGKSGGAPVYATSDGAIVTFIGDGDEPRRIAWLTDEHIGEIAGLLANPHEEIDA